MKLLSLFKVSVIFFLSLSGIAAFSQTTTSASGNWNTSGNWTAGVPNGAANATINHSMTLDATMTINSATYTFNAPVTDPVGGTKYNITLSNTSSIDIKSNVTIGGTLTMNGASASTYVRNGDTLTIGEPGGSLTSSFSGGSLLYIEAGGVVIVNGNLQFNSGSLATINGELIINGNFTGNNSSAISGTGTMNTTGKITNNSGGTVFGSGNDCTTGPCSGNNLCATNTIATAQTICSAATPAALTGNNPGGSYTYQWEVSTTSSTTGFTNIAGATSQGYSPGALTQDTWYRRTTTNGTCTATNVGIKITVNPNLTPSVSITSPTSTVCSGTSITFTATPTNGGAGPTYQWKKNAVNAGTGATYTNSTWTNGDAITCVMTSNYSCLTAGTATSNQINITVISGAGSWSGITSTIWATTSNWCSGAAPIATTDVTLNSGVTNMPTVNAAAQCRNLTINSGATLTVSSNTLTVNGTLTINSGGTLIISGGAVSAKTNIVNNGTISGAGTMTLNGVVAQNISGTGTYSNTTLNNTLGCTATSAVTVGGTLTLTLGQLTSNGNLTIDLNTGSIDGSGLGTISGNITTKKTVGSGNYHYISSPLTGLTATEWNDDITIKSGSYANLYSYDETNTDTSKSVGWTAQSSAAALTSLKGFALYFYGSTSLDETGTYTHSATYTNSGLTNTVSTVGASHNAASDGWNLVGNPYPSTLDWSAASGWTKTGLDNAIYFWDPANSRYASYVTGIGTNGGTQYIPSMQAFWVKVTNPGTGSLAMTNSVRVTSTNPSIWRTAAVSDILKLTAASGGYSDETIIRFRDDALDNFDSELDAYKMNSEDNTPSIYTELNNDQYSVNSLPYASKTSAIPVKVAAGFTGTYTISAEEIASLSGDSIIFEDRLLGIKQDLRTNPSYTCSLAHGDTSARFYISFRQGNVSGLNLSSPANPFIVIRGVEDNIKVRFLNDNSSKATIGVYTTLGEQVFKVENADISSGEYTINPSAGSNGIYIVKVVTDSQTTSKKVYLLR
jgi:hypothetical protein